MADQPTTTTEKLLEIIQAYAKLTTPSEIESYRRTLLPEEIKTLEAFVEGLKRLSAPLTPAPQPEKKPTPEPKPTPTPKVTPPLTQAEWQAKQKAEQEAKARAEATAIKKAVPTAIAPAQLTQPQPSPKQPTVKPELIIKRTHYPKWWNDEGIEKIALTSPGSQFVITAKSDFMLYIATIVLTVTGECVITFAFGSAGSGGAMNFGGEGQPMGIVIAMGNSPAPCGYGSFMVTATSDDAVTIGGFVSYFLWKRETP